MSEDNFDWDDDFDDFDDFSLESNAPDANAGPVKQAISAFATSAASSLSSVSAIRGVLDNVVPPGISSSLDIVLEGKDLIGSLFGNKLSEAKGDINAVSSFAASKAGDTFIGRKLGEIAKATEAEESSSAYEDPEAYLKKDSTAEVLAGIFDAQQKDQVVTEAIKSKLDIKELASSRAYRDIMAENSYKSANYLNDISTYNRSITASYQRKSLETSLKSFYVQKEMLRTSKMYYKTSFQVLEAIRHNTAISEHKKTSMMGHVSRDILTQRAQELVTSKTALGRLMGRSTLRVNRALDRGLGAMGMASTLTNAVQMQAEMDSLTGAAPKSGLTKAAGFIGGMGAPMLLGSLVSSLVGGATGSKLGKKTGLDGKLDKAHSRYLQGNRATDNISYKIRESLADNEINEGDGKLTRAKKKLFGGLHEIAYGDVDVSSNISSPDMDLDKERPLDTRFYRTVTDIIPGILLKSLSRLNLIAGVPDEKIAYDWKSSRFTSVNAISERAISQVSRVAAVEESSSSINDAIESLKKTGITLSSEESVYLKKYLRNVKAKKQVTGVGSLSYDEIADERTIAKLDTGEDKLVHTRIAAKMRSAGEDTDKVLDANRSLKSVLDSTEGSVDATIKDMLHLGYKDIVLKSFPFLKEEGGAIVRDSDAYQLWLTTRMEGDLAADSKIAKMHARSGGKTPDVEMMDNAPVEKAAKRLDKIMSQVRSGRRGGLLGRDYVIFRSLVNLDSPVKTRYTKAISDASVEQKAALYNASAGGDINGFTDALVSYANRSAIDREEEKANKKMTKEELLMTLVSPESTKNKLLGGNKTLQAISNASLRSISDTNDQISTITKVEAKRRDIREDSKKEGFMRMRVALQTSGAHIKDMTTSEAFDSMKQLNLDTEQSIEELASYLMSIYTDSPRPIRMERVMSYAHKYENERGPIVARSVLYPAMLEFNKKLEEGFEEGLSGKSIFGRRVSAGILQIEKNIFRRKAVKLRNKVDEIPNFEKRVENVIDIFEEVYSRGVTSVGRLLAYADAYIDKSDDPQLAHLIAKEALDRFTRRHVELVNDNPYATEGEKRVLFGLFKHDGAIGKRYYAADSTGAALRSMRFLDRDSLIGKMVNSDSRMARASRVIKAVVSNPDGIYKNDKEDTINLINALHEQGAIEDESKMADNDKGKEGAYSDGKFIKYSKKVHKNKIEKIREQAKTDGLLFFKAYQSDGIEGIREAKANLLKSDPIGGEVRAAIAEEKATALLKEHTRAPQKTTLKVTKLLREAGIDADDEESNILLSSGSGGEGGGGGSNKILIKINTALLKLNTNIEKLADAITGMGRTNIKDRVKTGLSRDDDEDGSDDLDFKEMLSDIKQKDPKEAKSPIATTGDRRAFGEKDTIWRNMGLMAALPALIGGGSWLYSKIAGGNGGVLSDIFKTGSGALGGAYDTAKGILGFDVDESKAATKATETISDDEGANVENSSNILERVLEKVFGDKLDKIITYTKRGAIAGGALLSAMALSNFSKIRSPKSIKALGILGSGGKLFKGALFAGAASYITKLAIGDKDPLKEFLETVGLKDKEKKEASKSVAEKIEAKRRSIELMDAKKNKGFLSTNKSVFNRYAPGELADELQERTKAEDASNTTQDFITKGIEAGLTIKTIKYLMTDKMKASLDKSTSKVKLKYLKKTGVTARHFAMKKASKSILTKAAGKGALKMIAARVAAGGVGVAAGAMVGGMVIGPIIAALSIGYTLWSFKDEIYTLWKDITESDSEKVSGFEALRLIAYGAEIEDITEIGKDITVDETGEISTYQGVGKGPKKSSPNWWRGWNEKENKSEDIIEYNTYNVTGLALLLLRMERVVTEYGADQNRLGDPEKQEEFAKKIIFLIRHALNSDEYSNLQKERINTNVMRFLTMRMLPIMEMYKEIGSIVLSLDKSAVQTVSRVEDLMTDNANYNHFLRTHSVLFRESIHRNFGDLYPFHPVTEDGRLSTWDYLNKHYQIVINRLLLGTKIRSKGEVTQLEQIGKQFLRSTGIDPDNEEKVTYEKRYVGSREDYMKKMTEIKKEADETVGGNTRSKSSPVKGMFGALGRVLGLELGADPKQPAPEVAYDPKKDVRITSPEELKVIRERALKNMKKFKSRQMSKVATGTISSQVHSKGSEWYYINPEASGPQQLQALILEMAPMFDFNPVAVEALMLLEANTSWDRKSVSPKSTAAGVLQVLDGTWSNWLRDFGKDLNIPDEYMKYAGKPSKQMDPTKDGRFIAKVCMALALANLKKHVSEHPEWNSAPMMYALHWRGDAGGPAIINYFNEYTNPHRRREERYYLADNMYYTYDGTEHKLFPQRIRDTNMVYFDKNNPAKTHITTIMSKIENRMVRVKTARNRRQASLIVGTISDDPRLDYGQQPFDPNDVSNIAKVDEDSKVKRGTDMAEESIRSSELPSKDDVVIVDGKERDMLGDESLARMEGGPKGKGSMPKAPPGPFKSGGGGVRPKVQGAKAFSTIKSDMPKDPVVKHAVSVIEKQGNEQVVILQTMASTLKDILNVQQDTTIQIDPIKVEVESKDDRITAKPVDIHVPSDGINVKRGKVS